MYQAKEQVCFPENLLLDFIGIEKKCDSDVGLPYNMLKSQWRMHCVFTFCEFINFPFFCTLDRDEYVQLGDDCK